MAGARVALAYGEPPLPLLATLDRAPSMQIAQRLGVTAPELMSPGEPVSSLPWMVEAWRGILDALDAGDHAGARRLALLAQGRAYDIAGG